MASKTMHSYDRMAPYTSSMNTMDTMDTIDGFNTLNFSGFAMTRSRYSQLVLDAEQNRLVQEAKDDQTTDTSLLDRVKNSLGRWMVEWGWRLQAQAGNKPNSQLTTR